MQPRVPLLLTVLGVALTACGLLPPVGGETFNDGTEALPGPGYFHGVTQPPEVQRSLTVGSFGEDGVESHVTESFSAGETVAFEGTGFAGWRGLTVNGEKCVGQIPITANMVTDVVLRLKDDGCEVTVSRVRPVDGG